MSIRNAFASIGLAGWIDRGIVAAVLLASGVALSLNVADPDLWGHVQYGRDAIARGLPTTTTYSYLAEGYPWINHEILAEYALALGADHLGGPGLLVIKCLLGMAIVGLMLRRSLKQGVGLIAACAAALLVAVCLGSHWTLRPQLFSYVSFTALLALLSYCFEGWEGRWQLWRRPVASAEDGASSSPPLEYSHSRLRYLWLAPLLMMVWTNAHGGFLAGLAIYIAYLGLRGLEAIVRKGRSADGLVVRFALMAAAAVVATLVNPYGPYFHTWLYDDLKVPRPEIVDWRAPDFGNPQTIPLLLVMIGWLACLVLSRRSRDLTPQVIFGLILWQSLMHSRHVAFLAIAFGWWMPVHLDSVLRRFGIGSAGSADDASRDSTESARETFGGNLSPRMQQALAAMIMLAILICGGRLAMRLTMVRVERQHYPVSAFEYIARQRLTGKLVCTVNWAQYALAAFGPREPGQPGILTQIDGRYRTSYSQEMLDMHFDLILGNLDASRRFRGPDSGSFNPLRSLEAGRPDLVLLSRHQEPGIAVMNSQRDRWIVLYQDELAQLWGRTSKYGDPRSAYYIPLSRRQITNDPQGGVVSWPAIPSYEPASTQPLRSVAIDTVPAESPGTNL